MDVATGLEQLGLSEYEAKAYAALLASPGANGYETAKLSGVPRAKVYEVLAGLVAKGAAQVSSEGGGRSVYYPTPHETLLQRHLERAKQTAAALRPLLAGLAAPAELAPLVTVRGYEALLAEANRIIAGAAEQLLIIGRPAELERLAPDLRAAEGRGVDIYPLVYGEAVLGLRRLFRHNEISLRGRAGGAVPVLIIVADHSEALMAEATASDRATGLVTRQQAVVLIAAEFVKHDIFLSEAVRRNEAAITDRLDDLQTMWFPGQPGRAPGSKSEGGR